jgi:hypothetical protein
VLTALTVIADDLHAADVQIADVPLRGVQNRESAGIHSDTSLVTILASGASDVATVLPSLIHLPMNTSSLRCSGPGPGASGTEDES